VAKRIRVIQLVQHMALGGGTVQAMVLAERLDPQRFEVTLAAGAGAGAEGSLREEMQDRGIRVLEVPHLVRTLHPVEDLRALGALRELINAEKPHIVDTHGSKTKLLLPLAARLAPVPIRVAHIGGWEWQAASGRLGEAIVTEASRLGRGSWDAIIPCSHATGRQGIERGIGRADQYHAIWPPVDLAQLRPAERDDLRPAARAELGLGADDFVMISVLRIARQKAPLDLLRMAGLVMQQRPDARLVVVGGGPMEAEFQAEIDRAGLTDRVLLLGPRRDLPRLLAASDVFTLLSAWEPFGIVFAEAAAMGLPTVGTLVDGIPEAVADGQSGVLVAPGDVEGAAREVLRIAADPGLAERMGRAGIAHAQQFSSERFVAETAAVYEKLLAAKGIG